MEIKTSGVWLSINSFIERQFVELIGGFAEINFFFLPIACGYS